MATEEMRRVLERLPERGRVTQRAVIFNSMTDRRVAEALVTLGLAERAMGYCWGGKDHYYAYNRTPAADALMTPEPAKL